MDNCGAEFPEGFDCCVPINTTMTTTVTNDIDLYINGYYDTQDKLLTETKYCTNISENCDDIIKSHDGTVWNFFSDMTVDLHAKQRCIKVTKDYKIVSSFCKNANSSIGIVCRLDCCKFFSTMVLFI